MKICSRCCEDDPNKFHKKNDNSYCKRCQSEYSKEHYLKNKIMYVKTRKRNQLRQNTKKREIINSLKESNSCIDCALVFPYYVMQFDHIFDKTANIGGLLSGNYSIDTILEEISKCELVCTNCHKDRTYKRRIDKNGIAKSIRPSVLYLRDYKRNKKCNDCEIIYPWWILEFDHISGEKTREVSSLAWYSSLNAVKNEIEKCQLVCGNCHAKRTHGSVAEYGDCISLEN